MPTARRRAAFPTLQDPFGEGGRSALDAPSLYPAGSRRPPPPGAGSPRAEARVPPAACLSPPTPRDPRRARAGQGLPGRTLQPCGESPVAGAQGSSEPSAPPEGPTVPTGRVCVCVCGDPREGDLETAWNRAGLEWGEGFRGAQPAPGAPASSSLPGLPFEEECYCLKRPY